MSKKRKKLVFSILAILVAITLLLTASVLVSCDPDATGNSGQTTGETTGGETSEPSEAEVAAKAVVGAFKAGVVDQDMPRAVEAAGAVVGTTLEDTPELRAALETELASFDQAFAEAYETTLPEGGLANFDFPNDGLLHVGLKFALGEGKALSATLKQLEGGFWNFKLETPAPEAGKLMTIDAIVDKDEHGNLRINADTTYRSGPDAAPSYDNHYMVLFGDEGLGPDDLVVESRSNDGLDFNRIYYFDLSKDTPEDTLLYEFGMFYDSDKRAGEVRFLEFDKKGLPIRAGVSGTQILKGGLLRSADKRVKADRYTADPAFFSGIDGLSSFTLVEDEGEVSMTALDMAAEMLEVKEFRAPAQSVQIIWDYHVDENGLLGELEFGWLELTARVEETLEEAGSKLQAAGFTSSDDDNGLEWEKDSLEVELTKGGTGTVEAELTISEYPEDEALKTFVDGWLDKLVPVRDSVVLSYTPEE